MRLHAIVAAGAAVLLCAAVVSCSQQEEESPPEAADSPVGADLEAEEEAEGGEEEDGEDEAAQEAQGWVSEPLAGAENGDEEGFPGVTGGAEGDTVTANDGDELAEHLASDEPLVVEVSGEIDLEGTMPVASNKTLRGADGAELTGGLVIDGVSNVIVANVHVRTENAAVDVRGGAHHVWVDGSTFVGGQDGSLVSVGDGADHVTLSWNHFLEAESVLAIGGAEEEGSGALRVTVHHNFFDGTAGRHPRARHAEHVHVFNNYFRANTEYGVQSAFESNVLVEGNYFADTEFSVAFEEEDPGNVAARDNLLVDSEQPDLRGDVPEPPYDYEMDDAATVPDTVSEGAGAE